MVVGIEIEIEMEKRQTCGIVEIEILLGTRYIPILPALTGKKAGLVSSVAGK